VNNGMQVMVNPHMQAEIAAPHPGMLRGDPASLEFGTKREMRQESWRNEMAISPTYGGYPCQTSHPRQGIAGKERASRE